jgi:hypothetical protein
MTYAVLWIHTGAIVYLGTSLFQAAEALEPGTCYGKSTMADRAIELADKWAVWFREREPQKSTRRRA